VRALRNLGIFVLVLLLVLVVLDFATRFFVENRIEREVDNADALDIGGADATVNSFPFLGRLAATGEVDHFTLTLTDVQTETVPLGSFRLEVDDVTFDRSNLANSQVEIDDIGSATVTATIDEATASEVVGAPVTLTEGEVAVTLNGQSQPAGVDLGDGTLVLSVPAGDIPAIPIPRNDYLPCAVEVTVEDGEFSLSCTVDDLPPVIDEAIGRARLG
jgi:hypothetical protein